MAEGAKSCLREHPEGSLEPLGWCEQHWQHSLITLGWEWIVVCTKEKLSEGLLQGMMVAVQPWCCSGASVEGPHSPLESHRQAYRAAKDGSSGSWSQCLSQRELFSPSESHQCWQGL